MTKIKICGLRRIEDIEYANELHPDYVGFVFSLSKRKISCAFAKMLIGNLDPTIKSVGVFVDEKIDFVIDVATSLNLACVQLHGYENESYIKDLKKVTTAEVWKALKIRSADDISFETVADKILLDSSIGGSGIPFDWNLLENFQFKKDIVLAGGLNILNVEDGIRKIRPYAVDISTGVESDGYKDFTKMKKFIEKVRSL